MKVLQVNCVYRTGSTGKIMYDIHTELQNRGIESVVCYGRGARVSEEHVYKTCPEWYSKLNNLLSRFTGLMYGGCFFSTARLIRIIKRERPDVVHLHCINGYFVNIYRLVTWLKESKIKTVLTLHAELMHTANCGHAFDCEKWKTGCGACPRLRKETKSLLFDRTHTSWKRMKRAFRGFDGLAVVAVSDWIADRAMQSPIFEGCSIRTIHNGIHTENFDSVRSLEYEKQLKLQYGIPLDKRIVLHVTPSFLNPVKGGEHVLALAELLPEEYICVVVGGGAVTTERLVAIPFVSNQEELAAFYKMADVFVITSRADNYPTVCLEANCCGTPVVGFDVGGVKETIADGMGTVVPYGDQEALCREARVWAERKAKFDEDTVFTVKKRNSRSTMCEEYISIY